jgi:hypothetical protein
MVRGSICPRLETDLFANKICSQISLGQGIVFSLVANVIYPVVFQRIEKRNGVGSILFNSDATVGLKFACKLQRYSTFDRTPGHKLLGISTAARFLCADSFPHGFKALELFCPIFVHCCRSFFNLSSTVYARSCNAVSFVR